MAPSEPHGRERPPGVKRCSESVLGSDYNLPAPRCRPPIADRLPPVLLRTHNVESPRSRKEQRTHGHHRETPEARKVRKTTQKAASSSRLPGTVRGSPRTECRRHSDVAALQPRRPLQHIPGHAGEGQNLQWTGGVSAAATPCVETRRVTLSQRGNAAVGTMDRAGRRTGGAPPPEAPEHHSLGQVDRHRSGVDQRSRRITRDIAVGHYKPINSERYLNDCHEFVFHFTPGGAPRSIASRWVFPTRTSRTSAAGAGGAEGVRCRGNTSFIPSRRFSAATAIVRTRPPSRQSCRSSAYACTDCRMLRR